MAKSKAQKQRAHALRNAKRDVTTSRANDIPFSTHVRKTKSKQEKLIKQVTKHKKRHLHDLGSQSGRDVFYCA
ncbi:MAG: hypothetical protein LRY73_09240 [Bacillus sp. (in: Bacteria)]|nr:hypothetical protein [Bacillus sp. (in: firmicutes)]